MRHISLETLKILNTDGFMLRCCLCGGWPPQYHHNLIYSGKQSDDSWTILPLCSLCHSKEKQKETGEKLDWIMLNRATEEQLKSYSKIINLVDRRNALNKIYGHYSKR